METEAIVYAKCEEMAAVLPMPGVEIGDRPSIGNEKTNSLGKIFNRLRNKKDSLERPKSSMGKSKGRRYCDTTT